MMEGAFGKPFDISCELACFVVAFVHHLGPEEHLAYLLAFDLGLLVELLAYLGCFT
jgi:hypothetical protein